MSQEIEKKSALRVIVHSFFVVPFLIALFGVLIFFMWRLLTHEPRVAEDYITDVRIGSATKRWQSAYELSKIIASPDWAPQDDRFATEMLTAYEYSLRDPDTRVRQYLIRAMGNSGLTEFSKTIQSALAEPGEAVVADAVYALGLIGGDQNLTPIVEMTEHQSDLVRNRSAIALGNLGLQDCIPSLQKLLYDIEPNVRWNAAVSLAKLDSDSGRDILLNLLHRGYLEEFDEVDPYEQTEAMLTAINAASLLGDSSLNAAIMKLSQEDMNMKVRDAAMKALNL
ncbi:MAG: HEAT repeat domain-containing protein [Candidatus Marinimicrobia bacterium]|jgi:hypothetical protein|nr:HEAT repeat domain-containing protein [Candidatus Neomarinimicrobiota bacterium]MDP6836261.1 HEAT repeat domain-containing protein [Candidatus Neomarinimicrobiota bacterium]|tara:strand:- start:464 stop:1309 length:846 start_codon:yes stop_codon:yes gene_type:complete